MKSYRDSVINESHPVIKRWLRRVVVMNRVIIPRVKVLTRGASKFARVAANLDVKHEPIDSTIRVVSCPLSAPLPPGKESDEYLQDQLKRFRRSAKKAGRPEWTEWTKAREAEAANYTSLEAVEEARRFVKRGYLIVQVDKMPDVGLIVHKHLYEDWLRRALESDPDLHELPGICPEKALRMMIEQIHEWNAETSAKEYQIVDPKEVSHAYVLPKAKRLNICRRSGFAAWKAGGPDGNLPGLFQAEHASMSSSACPGTTTY